jgi:hypothetical protein
MGQKKAGEAGEAIAPKKRRMKGNKDSKQMEGPNPSKSGEQGRSGRITSRRSFIQN